MQMRFMISGYSKYLFFLILMYVTESLTVNEMEWNACEWKSEEKCWCTEGGAMVKKIWREKVEESEWKSKIFRDFGYEAWIFSVPTIVS